MKKYSFKCVARQGQVGVVEVERNGSKERCMLPMEVIALSNGGLTSAQIDSGIPYGLPFAEFIDHPQAEATLHHAGIWTVTDLYTKAQIAVGALHSIGLKLSAVIKAAEAYQKEDHKNILKSVPKAETPKIKSKRSKNHGSRNGI